MGPACNMQVNHLAGFHSILWSFLPNITLDRFQQQPRQQTTIRLLISLGVIVCIPKPIQPITPPRATHSTKNLFFLVASIGSFQFFPGIYYYSFYNISNMYKLTTKESIEKLYTSCSECNARCAKEIQGVRNKWNWCGALRGTIRCFQSIKLVGLSFDCERSFILMYTILPALCLAMYVLCALPPYFRVEDRDSYFA